MNQAHLVEVFKAWDAIDDAERVITGYLCNEGQGVDDLHDILDGLVASNSALSVLLTELLCIPVEEVREQLLQAQREAILGGNAGTEVA